MTIPDEMTAAIVEGGKGPASALKTAQIETPRPQTGQILIRVRAAGVNRPDVIQRLGMYPPPPGAPQTLGLEVAGEVAAVGEGAQRWKVGDAVVALLGGGGYAEYAVVDARHALPLPKGLDFIQAAGLPETVFTVWANVFEAGQLKAGETLLVHGATSGIGVTAIQMAKAAGARVIATSRGAAKAGQAKSLGADVAIDAGADDFAAAVQAEGGADVVLDMVGGAYVGKDIDAMRPRGRIVMIATQGGSNADVNLLKMMQRRLVLTGSTLRPRDADEKARIAAAIEKTVWPWIEAGKVKTIVDSTFPLAEVAAAHARLESDAHLGKIVLTL
jgi:NADPH2:quinone reductase